MDAGSRYGAIVVPSGVQQQQQHGAGELSINEDDLRDAQVACGAKMSDGEASLSETMRKRRAVLRNKESRAGALLRSSLVLPEPEAPSSGTARVVTLRVRSLNVVGTSGRREVQTSGRGMGSTGWDDGDYSSGSGRRALPEFAEGDVIVGFAYEYVEGGNESGDDDDDDEHDDGSNDETETADDSGMKKRRREWVFRVLDVCWGVQAYVNLFLDGRYGGGGVTSSTASQNCFLVCSLVADH